MFEFEGCSYRALRSVFEGSGCGRSCGLQVTSAKQGSVGLCILLRSSM